MSTLNGIGPGGWDSGNLAREQESKAATTPDTSKVVYRLYTEDFPNLKDLTSRYFSGATFLYGNGLWMDVVEATTVIEVVGTIADLQSITHLAGDIRAVNNQQAVLITWNRVSSLLVTE